MSQSKTYFGTDGIRGVAGAFPLDPETLVRLGKAIARVFLRRKGKHQVLIAKDTRLSGYMIETALSAGITASGADVLLVGPLPTPGASYLTKSMRADAGVMISASHNPFEDNGIKIFGADGFKLADDLEREIANLLDGMGEPLVNADPTEIGKATRINDAVGRYTVYLKEAFPREFTLDGLKIGIDCGNGAGYVVGPQTFKELGAEVVSRGISPTGRNINAGFGSLYPEVMSKLVVEQHLNIGISLDGDADRCILTDDKGNVLDGDMILSICAADLHSRGLLPGNTVVSTVMSNLGLEKFLKPKGIRVLRTQVGDRYVLEEMLKSGASLGGEQSGHTIFLNHATTGDGILTALMVLSVMCRTGKSLSELSKDFIKFPQKLVNIPVSSKPPLESLSSVSEVIAKKEKELRDSGRILVRYSGTENKARIMVECESETDCKRHAADVAEVIEREIGVS
jgi:phosphoglucosamine mutase